MTVIDCPPPTSSKPRHSFAGWARPLFEYHRFKVLHGGRGSGKSWQVARALVTLAARKPLRILCAREVQRSIRDSVHRLLCDQIELLGLGAGYKVTDAEIKHANGSLFVFSGLAQHTVESIKSLEGCSICWIEEAQTLSERSWTILTPTIRAEGSEIWMTLNPDMDTDPTYQRFVENPEPNAWVQEVNWKDNPWFTAELEMERQSTLRRDPAAYPNIWEGQPKRVADGAIYRYELMRVYEEKRVRPVAYDPLLKVHTVWDLGYADSMAIGMWQRQGSEVRCIDYIEDSYRTLDYYVAEIEKRKYRWGSDFIPHDGRARDFKTGKSTEEHLATMGRNPCVLPLMGVEEGIKAARLMFPRIWFDETRCAGLLEHLKRYQRVIPLGTGEPAGPLHDVHSHAADMLRYAGMAVELMGNVDKPERITYTRRYLA